MPQPSTTPEQQVIARYKRDPKFARELDVKFAHQHKLSETEMSCGTWVEFDDDDIEVKSQCTSRPYSFFNSYWFVVVTILAFLGAIFLTNGCLGL